MTFNVAPEPLDVIKVDSVSKKFVLRKDKSLKERIVNAGRNRKHIERYTALDDVSFSVQAGESLGLTGANGSGKSTLLKLIGGIISPDSGSVKVRGRIAALLELGAGFHPDLTGMENIFLNASIMGLSEEEIDAQIDSIIDFSGISDFINTQVKFYSSGMYVRLAFSVAVHSNPDILLVDEVLAVGDEPFQRKCMERIRQFQDDGRSIILVSHSPDQIVEMCDRALVLQKGELITIGPTRESMNILHKSYAKQIQVDRAKSTNISPEVEEALHNLKITDVRASGFTRLPSGVDLFLSGNNLTISIDLDTQVPLEDYTAELTVEALDGTKVFTMNSANLDQQLPPLSSTGTIDIVIPNFYLGEGQFVFNVLISNSSGITLAHKANALILQVGSDAKTSGLIKAFPEITVKAD
ncbi:ABC transporter ATP-binding protein [Arcanobacterium phocisimile]|uniref:ABC transporter ATP-binding protein n=1 Tax=Arcanobacterium phocisimile TaxID=1302235 RepID=A0ABX7IH02_9ACTO|nr:ABC transporter ATP-binding protein [Arcanobacterium phocisimile]QRV02237.1 ABC transporter ATP-binding protein [Arcanobacterium phocisimile]